jgi:peptidoglycan LD-endopeptidase CwlK
MDGITRDRVMKLHPKLRNEALQIIDEIEKKDGIKIRVVQSTRTHKEQADIYAQGRTKPGKVVTWAKPGSSFHNYGLALDFCILHADGSISWSLHEDLDEDKKADWFEVISRFKRYGWETGAEWRTRKDYPHLEKTFGLDITDCISLFTANKVDGDGYIII